VQSKTWILLALASIVVSALGACGAVVPGGEQAHKGQGVYEHEMADLEPIALGEGEKLKVVATTNVVGDVVLNVGGDRIDLVVLMEIGVDPHTYVPTPADTVAIHDAHVVFANGAGLEADLEEIFENAGGEAHRVYLSEDLELRPSPGQHEGEGEEEGGHDHGEVDPHVWFSVPNVIHWLETIEQTLSALDPAHAEVYEGNARAYTRKLEELDAWIEGQVALIREENRKLVTNHTTFGYFADRYGLEQIGALYPVNPSSEPSAQDIVVLQDAIREFGVPAVFAESTVNPKLAEQVARDTGVQLVPLYTGSLGGPGSGAETYIELMRYDVNAIVEALQ
jgi:ABC-type Zn uptake system ZnuABC Zn-binding protein ZnuA